jgi:hypothetical protein
VLITRIRDGIEKLKEYSTALISAAMGKIDVRGEIDPSDSRILRFTTRYEWGSEISFLP